MIAPSPVCFASHLSPTLWGRGSPSLSNNGVPGSGILSPAKRGKARDGEGVCGRRAPRTGHDHLHPRHRQPKPSPPSQWAAAEEKAARDRRARIQARDRPAGAGGTYARPFRPDRVSPSTSRRSWWFSARAGTPIAEIETADRQPQSNACVRADGLRSACSAPARGLEAPSVGCSRGKLSAVRGGSRRARRATMCSAFARSRAAAKNSSRADRVAGERHRLRSLEGASRARGAL